MFPVSIPVGALADNVQTDKVCFSRLYERAYNSPVNHKTLTVVKSHLLQTGMYNQWVSLILYFCVKLDPLTA